MKAYFLFYLFFYSCIALSLAVDNESEILSACQQDNLDKVKEILQNDQYLLNKQLGQVLYEYIYISHYLT